MLAGMSNKDGAAGGFLYRSSLADDVWHADAAPGAYEWWYFDAASADGRDALVVIFLADFIFSPRFNRHAARRRDESAPGGANFGGSVDASAARALRFPAVAVSFYRDGRPLFRAVNEYAAEDFDARTDRPACRIGRSDFRLETSSRGATFRVSLDEPLRRGRRLAASLAWEVVEGGFSDGETAGGGGEDFDERRRGAHEWNMVAPRCRVEGSLAVAGRGEARAPAIEFRGTGYHDHNRDRRWLPDAVGAWQWGRAHFAESTAVFYSFRGRGAAEPVTRLFLARGGALSAHAARLTRRASRRHVFGLRYPRELRLEAEESGVSLSVRQGRVADGSFFYLRLLGEATLDDRAGPPQTAPALTELLAPRALRWRWLDWLTDMRIGRGGRASFLK